METTMTELTQLGEPSPGEAGEPLQRGEGRILLLLEKQNLFLHGTLMVRWVGAEQ